MQGAIEAYAQALAILRSFHILSLVIVFFPPTHADIKGWSHLQIIDVMT